ncbi:MAG TPA: class I SAM-dependent methyltransferase [Thermoanaerobaculia bacterium]|nr:class I SAM-dependent methyltransferase [Thermoanaerobaculia bacterium]
MPDTAPTPRGGPANVKGMRDVPFTRSLPMRLLRRRASMAADWDERARRDALLYIRREAAGSPDAFEASGRRELDDEVLRGVSLPPDAVVVEIGCGIGRLARAIAPRVKKVYAGDLSSEMLDRAREFCAGCGNVELLRFDGSLAGVPSGCADFVYSHLVFQHVPRLKFIRTYFREAGRVLKPGGVFRANVDGRSRQWYRRYAADSWSGVVFSDRRLRRELERAGFRVERTEGAATQYLWATARRE